MPTPKEWADNLERLHKIGFPDSEPQEVELLDTGKPDQKLTEEEPSEFDKAITNLAEETIGLLDAMPKEGKVAFLKFVFSYLILEAYARADAK